MGRRPPPDASYEDELTVEPLYEDSFVVTAGMHSRWARRRKIDLAELIDEPWMLTAPDTWNHRMLAEAFRARDLAMPKIRVVTDSIQLRTELVGNGPFVTALAESVARKNGLKLLPVDLSARVLSVVIITLKNRTLSPVAQLFIDHVRDVTRPLREGLSVSRQ